jgi:UDP-N-acetylmuramoylalanine--D-glutamate ligase
LRQKADLQDYINQVDESKIEWDLGRHTSKLFTTSEMIVVSPGVPLNIKPLDEAREAHIMITNEVELGASALKEPLIAVTGTNGKTTTTTLIGEFFKADGRKPFVGGNIGKPLLDYTSDQIRSDVVVAELSSFQLELTQRLIPAVAVFCNIEEDHLDRYPSMDAYVAAKKRLLQACDKNSFVVLNYDCAIVSKFAEENTGKLLWFTKKNPIEIGGEFAENFVGCYFNSSKKQIIARISGKEEIYDLTHFRLMGDHNRENLMAAICAARAMGVSPTAIQTVINQFAGVPHRLEFVRRKNGVYFFNDSKGTNVMSVKRSLSSFQVSPVILIAGGKDKNQDFTPLAELVRQKVKILILVGEAKEKLNRAMGDHAETFLVGTFEEAILLAYQKSRSGDVILLSPGCASFDMFRNYEERGDYFKKLVNQL